jgi:hypothetical protein
MQTKKEICHDLALEYAKIAILHPEKLTNDEKMPNIPSLNQFRTTRLNFAQYYSNSFDWFYENFESYIGSKVLDHMD